ncbi:acyltransferase [Candidatus Avelusimicrobium fimicolum]|uniref:acyltransferase n=1 Tax=Candidatus Avelusimicrobium fimicolum TaxID=3416216 RepID=UPI003D0DC568
MTEREKMLLHSKYGHNKVLLFMHLMGRYIKGLYHPNIKIKKPLILGKGNIIPFVPKGVQIEIYGDNNKVEIDPSVKTWNGHIVIGNPGTNTPTHNCLVRIGKNSDSNGVWIDLLEDNSAVIIGNNCMLSWNIHIFASDSHTIYDAKTKKLLNWGKEIIIGDNVWVAMDCTVLKNSFIAKNCVVGASAVVAGKFTEENCVIAGNPAKVVKRGVAWDRRMPKEYITQYPME